MRINLIVGLHALTFFLTSLFFVSSTFAQSEYPNSYYNIQSSENVAGDFKDQFPIQFQTALFSNSSGYSELNWHIGYFVTDSFYVGYSHFPSFTLDVGTRSSLYSFSGNDEDKVERGRKIIREIRIHFFDVLYLSIGNTSIDKSKRISRFDKRTRLIGSNYYNTSIETSLSSHKFNGLGAGIGINLVLPNGISLGISSFFTDIYFKDRIDSDSVRVVTPDETLSTQDLELLKKDIIADTKNGNRDSEMYFPQSHVAILIGYNF